MFVLVTLVLYILGCAVCFACPYLALRKLRNEFYGPPTNTTVYTCTLQEGSRTIIIHLRDRGMADFDRVLVRTPDWDEAEVKIPRPKALIPKKP